MKYTIEWSNEDDCWIGEYDECSGAKGHGRTPTEALANVMESVIVVLSVQLEAEREAYHDA